MGRLNLQELATPSKYVFALREGWATFWAGEKPRRRRRLSGEGLSLRACRSPRRRLKLWSVLVAAVCCGFFFAPAAAAQTGARSPSLWLGAEAQPPPLPPVKLIKRGVWGGAVNVIEPHGDIVYIGAGRRLVILHVDDLPRGGVEVTELGSVDLGNTVHDFKVRDGYAYVAVHEEPHFFVVNVTDPTQPAIAWTNNTTSLLACAEVELYGDYALVRDAGKIRRIGITDPTHPIVYASTLSTLESTLIVGDRLYAVASTQMRIYNIVPLASPPGFPTFALLGSAPLPGGLDVAEGTAVAVDGDIVYTLNTGEDGTFAAYDASVPASPVLCDSLALGEFLGNANYRTSSIIAASNGIAYVADPDSSSPGLTHCLGMVDVSDCSDIALVSSFHTHSNAITKIVLDGARGYAADNGEGLLVLDLSDRLNPVVIGGYHSPANIRKKDKVGPYLYVTDEFNGISALRVANPDKPLLRGVYQTAEGAVDIDGFEIRNDLAYLAVGWAGLEVVDVGNPTGMSLVGSYSFPTPNQAMALALDETGTIAHVGVTFGWIVNFDVHNPQRITDSGAVNIGGGDPKIFTIDAQPDSLLHIARTQATVVVNSIGPPKAEPFTQPFVIGIDPSPIGVVPRDLVVTGNRRYVAFYGSHEYEGVAGLIIQDVSDPAAPAVLGHVFAIDTTAVAFDESSGHILFNGGDPANNFRATLFAVNPSDPTSPVIVDKVRIVDVNNGLIWANVSVEDGFAYVSGRGMGLVIYEIQRQAQPTLGSQRRLR